MSRVAGLSVLLPFLWCAPTLAQPGAFVINEGSGSVSIIDTKTDDVSATFHVGERPSGLAVTLEGERVYVSLDDGTIVERDMYAKQPSGGVKLGRQTSAIDVSPDGKLLVAAFRTQSEIALLDPAMMRVVTTIRVHGGTGVANVAFSPDGHWVYAVAEGGDELHVIDVRRRAVTKSIRVGAGLRGVSFVPDGTRAYVVSDQENDVVVIDVARQAILARIRTASGPSAVTPHPDGKRVFVTAAGAGKVQVLDTRVNRIVAEFDVCSGASSIAATLDGRKVYVTCSHANQVWVYEGSTYTRVAQLAVGVKPVRVVIREVDPPAGGTFFPPPREKAESSYR